METAKRYVVKHVSIGRAPEKTYLSFMIPASERESTKKMCSYVQKKILYIPRFSLAGIAFLSR